MADEFRKLLNRCDELAREHCGMPIDIERMVANQAYRETVFGVLARSSHDELAKVADTVRRHLATRQPEGVR